MCGGDGQAPTDPYVTPAHLRPSPAETAVDGDLVVEEFPLDFDGYTYRYSRLAYVKGRRPAPVVLVHHNYAGLKQFDVDVACFLAKSGYVGLAVDLYKEHPDYMYADRNVTLEADAIPNGEATLKKHFQNAFKCMNTLYVAPRQWRNLMGAYLQAAFEHPAVAAGLAGAIGYCLGGQSCLEQLRAGHQLQAIVTFHGLLQSLPMVPDSEGEVNPGVKASWEDYQAKYDIPENTYTPGCIVVIENGQQDGEVPAESIGGWIFEMDMASIDWRFHSHGGGVHGFALAPGVTGTHYQEKVDRRSTLSMLATFAEAWPDFPQYYVEANGCGTSLPKSQQQEEGKTSVGVSKTATYSKLPLTTTTRSAALGSTYVSSSRIASPFLGASASYTVRPVTAVPVRNYTATTKTFLASPSRPAAVSPFSAPSVRYAGASRALPYRASARRYA
eukprot:gnl/TRDRNA2_/TRDRNA2_43767_c0_seq1.p1 gnl/TRDRNA2_/TRDRNA2_43767_c0~~gnl/TRDRNA2_/TRDRNA2_43767_c0_seq1.p1  ORF type:complete len:443 (-),score=59.13 gnl/TRDRNA2_/TRDRNA2_43767_c0_seq1:167-1495(-)